MFQFPDTVSNDKETKNDMYLSFIDTAYMRIHVDSEDRWMLGEGVTGPICEG